MNIIATSQFYFFQLDPLAAERNFIFTCLHEHLPSGDEFLVQLASLDEMIVPPMFKAGFRSIRVATNLFKHTAEPGSPEFREIQLAASTTLGAKGPMAVFDLEGTLNFYVPVFLPEFAPIEAALLEGAKQNKVGLPEEGFNPPIWH